MKCAYHPLRAANIQCKNCFAPLCEDCIVHGEGKKKVLCSRCVVLVAGVESFQEIVSDSIECEAVDRQRLLAIERKKKRLRLIQSVVIVGALLIVSFQIPHIVDSLQPEKSLRTGAEQSDELTDQCVLILWQIAKLLQEGKMPGDEMVCPASNKPFEITRSNGDIIVRSPHPELYGLIELRVSRDRPVPELVK